MSVADRLRQAGGLGLARLAHGVLRLRRSVVESQLADSFPERDENWVRTTAAACYRHFGRETALMGRRPDRLKDLLRGVLIDEESRSLFDELGGSARGAVIVSGHIGNWELGGGYLAHVGLRPAVVAVRQGRVGERRLSAIRAGLGLDVIYRDEGSRPLVRALREGRAVGLVADQHAWSGSAPLPFLGRPAWTPLGPARLAIATDVPLYFSALVREGDAHRVTLRGVEASEDRDVEGAAEAWTRGWLRVLEASIEATPAQYFWFHRRWKGAESAERALRQDADGSRTAVEVERAGAEDVG